MKDLQLFWHKASSMATKKSFHWCKCQSLWSRDYSWSDFFLLEFFFLLFSLWTTQMETSEMSILMVAFISWTKTWYLLSEIAQNISHFWYVGKEGTLSKWTFFVVGFCIKIASLLTSFLTKAWQTHAFLKLTRILWFSHLVNHSHPEHRFVRFSYRICMMMAHAGWLPMY